MVPKDTEYCLLIRCQILLLSEETPFLYFGSLLTSQKKLLKLMKGLKFSIARAGHVELRNSMENMILQREVTM